jgi:outer membrane protein assembly factor BamE (lipoprotein component of BamABCDE complex)
MNNQYINKAGLLLLIFFLIQSCTTSIEIEGFSSKDWKSDRNGCKNTRLASIKTLMMSRDKILGQEEHSILNLLGRPDKNELLRRQQKFYFYYLEPSPLCDNITSEVDSASYLSIHFNATGVVNEIFVYE